MIRPAVNLNGDTKQTLLDQTTEARRALQAAAVAMIQAAPHGRNYQTGGDFQADRQEFSRRIKLIQELADLYHQDTVAIAEQS